MKRSHISLKDIERWHRQGRGVGDGYQYRPWLRVREVPSLGRARRLKGLKTGRVHHLLSDLEYKHFLMLEFNDQVVDIREQYPLFPLDQLIGIAKARAITYPTYVGTSTPYVLTTDLLVTYRGDDGLNKLHARTIKYLVDLDDDRALEKLELERAHWEIKNATWDIGTEESINHIFFKNLNWLRFRLDSARRLIDPSKLAIFLTIFLNECNSRKPLRNLIEQGAIHTAISYEIAIIWFKFLVWHKVIKLDLHSECLSLLAPIQVLFPPGPPLLHNLLTERSTL